MRASLPLLAIALFACTKGNEATPSSRPADMATASLPPEGSCKDVPSKEELDKVLKAVASSGNAGGLANGRAEWAAVVNRYGEICAVAVSTKDPSEAWGGSQGIAKAKAYTANGFSTDTAPLSTARLYTLAQPGHSLFGAGAGNPFNPECLTTPVAPERGPKVCGGTVVFGGGLPLYKDKARVGGIGLSGDTACADHEVAKQIRNQLKMDPPGGMTADDIIYTRIDGASPYAHPMCPNTWRNGKRLGDEAPASGY